MNIPEFCIKRPVTTYMVYLGVSLLGLIALTRLPQELYPPITFPEVSIVTNYLNAAPEEIETLITRPIEEAVGSVGGLKGVRSASREGTSIVTCSFHWGTNIDFAALELREKIDLVKDRLPHECDEPVVVKFNPLDRPIMILSVTGSMSQMELRDVTTRKIKDAIEKVPGVASASVSGGEERQILVEIDQGRLQAANSSLLEVVESLRNTNYNYPAGTITGGQYEFLLRTAGEFKGIKDIRETVVGVETKEQTDYDLKRRRYIEPLDAEESHKTTSEQRREENKPRLEKRLVMLQDLGDIKDTVKEKTSFSRYSGKPNISISIQKQASGNTIRVCDEVKRTLKNLEKELPKNIKVETIYDHSGFIKQAIGGSRDDALQGSVLAFGALYLVMRSVFASLIVIMAIPICVLVCFFFMFAMHMSLNTMTLGGLALGVGMMIDNGVVTVENIFRHRQMGKPAQQAAVEATNEVMASQVGSTLTNVAVFFPLILFVPGIAGQLFKQLSWTIIVAQILSLIVAVTIIPLLATYMGIKKEMILDEDKMEVKTWFSKLTRPKQNRILKLILGGIGGLFVISLLCSFFLDAELLPKVDQGQFLIRVNMPSGTLLKKTDEMVGLVEKKILNVKDVESTAVSVGSDKSKTAEGGVVEILGPNQGQILVNLKKKRKLSSHDVVKILREELSHLHMGGAQLEYIVQESEFQFAQGTSAPIVVEVKGYRMSDMAKLVKEIETKMDNVPGLYNIKNDRGEPHPETKVEIDKEKSALYGISVNEISLTAKVAIDGLVATTLKEAGRDIDVRVQLRPEDRAQISNVSDLLVHSPSLRTSVSLSQTAHLVKGMGPTEIKRVDQERTVLITAAVESGVNKTKMERQIQKMVNKLTDLPKDFTVKLVGEKEEVREAFTKLFFALFLAVILVYMIMASQFESLMQPFFIMFTVPLSLIGVIFALLLTGTPLSIIALLGVIILGGVVVNNGIVLVDFSNMRMKQGASAEEAAEIASRVRARPILMSASTTLVGLIPLALGLGEGAELRSPMARAVMGGLLISTLLTLFVMPALYILNERIFHKEQSPEVHELKEKVRFQLHHIFSLFVPWVSTKLKGLFNKRRKDSAS